MTTKSAKRIWQVLLTRDGKLVTSETIHRLADQTDKDPTRSIRYLQEHRYITRILRGVFYVNSPIERETGSFDKSIYEIVAEALTLKGVTNWYIALETALRINGLTHEYFTVNFIMTDSFRTTKAIKIADAKFRFFRRSKKYFSFGILKKFDLKYSDKEKTVLDLVYKRYLDSHDDLFAISQYVELRDRLDHEKTLLYVKNYPIKIQEMVDRVS